MENERWKEHAYPLQQITIKLQGTRHSERSRIIDLLEDVLKKLQAGQVKGQAHDDDFGYSFVVNAESNGPTFFEEPCG